MKIFNAGGGALEFRANRGLMSKERGVSWEPLIREWVQHKRVLQAVRKRLFERGQIRATKKMAGVVNSYLGILRQEFK